MLGGSLSFINMKSVPDAICVQNKLPKLKMFTIHAENVSMTSIQLTERSDARFTGIRKYRGIIIDGIVHCSHGNTAVYRILCAGGLTCLQGTNYIPALCMVIVMIVIYCKKPDHSQQEQ